MIYFYLIIGLILVLILLYFVIKKYESKSGSCYKPLKDIPNLDIKKSNDIEFLKKILYEKIEYDFDIVSRFWETKDSQIEELMEKILEKFDTKRAFKFIELRIELIEKSIKNEINKNIQSEKILDNYSQLNDKFSEESVKIPTQLIVESPVRKLTFGEKHILNPVVYNFLYGCPEVKEYCAAVMPYINFPNSEKLLLGSFMDTKSNDKTRYNSIISLKKSWNSSKFLNFMKEYIKKPEIDSKSKSLVVKLLGEMKLENAKAMLLKILKGTDLSLKIASALALSNFDDEEVLDSLVKEAVNCDCEEFFNSVSSSLEKFNKDDIANKLQEFSEIVDLNIQKIIMRLISNLKLKKLTPFVKRILMSEDIDLKMLAGNFLLDNEEVREIDLLLKSFKSVDDFLMESAKNIGLNKKVIEDAKMDENKAFYLVNNMGDFLNEEDFINSSVNAFKTGSKYLKGIVILKVSNCKSKECISIIKEAIKSKDNYIFESAINSISKRKTSDLDYLLIDSLKNCSENNMTIILNTLIKKGMKLPKKIIKKLMKHKNEYVKILVNSIKES